MVGNEFAVTAFIHQAISRLAPPAHLAAAKEIAAPLGRIMPLWYAAGLVTLLAELWVRRVLRNLRTLPQSKQNLPPKRPLVTIPKRNTASRSTHPNERRRTIYYCDQAHTRPKVRAPPESKEPPSGRVQEPESARQRPG